MSATVPLVRVSGTPYERGAQMGAAFAEATARSVAFNRRYLARHDVGAARLDTLLAPYVSAAIASLPHLVEQVRGMADGADQPFLDLFFANAFEEVYGVLELSTPSALPLERCTDVVLRAPGSTLLGHNEQWYSGDDGTVGLVLDVSDDGPAVLAPVVAGTLPLVGLNELGGAFGTMSLSATDERVGVPRALVARQLLEAGDRGEAFARASIEGRAGGYSYLCAFPGGDSFAIETTATTAALLDLTEHTNHAIDPGVAAAACDPSEGSSRAWRGHAFWCRRPLPRSTEWRACCPTTGPRGRTSACTRTPPTVTKARRSSSRWSANPSRGRCGSPLGIPAPHRSNASASGRRSSADQAGLLSRKRSILRTSRHDERVSSGAGAPVGPRPRRSSGRRPPARSRSPRPARPRTTTRPGAQCRALPRSA